MEVNTYLMSYRTGSGQRGLAINLLHPTSPSQTDVLTDSTERYYICSTLCYELFKPNSLK